MASSVRFAAAAATTHMLSLPMCERSLAYGRELRQGSVISSRECSPTIVDCIGREDRTSPCYKQDRFVMIAVATTYYAQNQSPLDHTDQNVQTIFAFSQVTCFSHLPRQRVRHMAASLCNMACQTNPLAQ